MTSTIVLDSSAVIALLRDEPGAAIVADHVGSAAISAVNLQEVVKALRLRGVDILAIDEILRELRLDLHPHDRDDAIAAGCLVEATQQYGSGLGDRSCMALAMKLGVPALTTDRDWEKVAVEGLSISLIR